MLKRRMRCPKCGDNRASIVGAGDFEELHCDTCGQIVYIGALRERQAERRARKSGPAAAEPLARQS